MFTPLFRPSSKYKLIHANTELRLCHANACSLPVAIQARVSTVSKLSVVACLKRLHWHFLKDTPVNTKIACLLWFLSTATRGGAIENINLLSFKRNIKEKQYVSYHGVIIYYVRMMLSCNMLYWFQHVYPGER